MKNYLLIKLIRNENIIKIYNLIVSKAIIDHSYFWIFQIDLIPLRGLIVLVSLRAFLLSRKLGFRTITNRSIWIFEWDKHFIHPISLFAALISRKAVVLLIQVHSTLKWVSLNLSFAKKPSSWIGILSFGLFCDRKNKSYATPPMNTNNHHLIHR